MSDKQIQITVTILLIVLFGSMFYAVHHFFYLMKQHEVLKNAWEKSIKVLDTKKQNRKKLERKATALYGEMEHKTIMAKLDATLSYSGIYAKFPKMTAEYIVSIVMIFALIIGIATWFFSKKLLYALIGMVGIIAILYEAMLTIRLFRNKKITDELVHFLDVAEMGSLTRKDVVSILKYSAFKVKEPLRTELLLTVLDAEHTGNSSLALRKLINRVENKYLKDLLLNLDICSKFKANYSEVLKATKKIFLQDVANREKLRKAYQNSLSYNVVMVIVGFFVIQLFGGVVQVDNTFAALWGSGIIGQLIILYLVGMSVFSIWTSAIKTIL